jgi:hypothetical protein
MIHKTELKGKNIEYIDRNGATRISKVYRVSGKTLTVGHIMMLKKQRYKLNWERIHPEKNKIHGVYTKKGIIEIQWNKRKKKDGEK